MMSRYFRWVMHPLVLHCYANLIGKLIREYLDGYEWRRFWGILLEDSQMHLFGRWCGKFTGILIACVAAQRGL
jgi:hypothetical protein